MRADSTNSAVESAHCFGSVRMRGRDIRSTNNRPATTRTHLTLMLASQSVAEFIGDCAFP